MILFNILNISTSARTHLTNKLTFTGCQTSSPISLVFKILSLQDVEKRKAVLEALVRTEPMHRGQGQYTVGRASAQREELVHSGQSECTEGRSTAKNGHTPPLTPALGLYTHRL